MQSHADVKRLCTAALLSAMALALQYLESLLPPLVPGIPVKLGLANLVTLYTMLRFSRRDAFIVSALRVLLFPLLSGAVSGFFYAAAGTLLSFAVMALLLPIVRAGRLSPVGQSVAGAFLFHVGQTLVGLLTVGRAMLAYFPYMGLISIPAGALTGFLAMFLAKRLAGARPSASPRS